MPRHERQEANKFLFGFMIDTPELATKIFGPTFSQTGLSVNLINELNLSFPERLEMAQMIYEHEC